MSEDTKSKTTVEQKSNDTQKRTTGFPTLTLQRAIGLMQKVWVKENRNAAPATAIVEHWGYAAKSSGGFQALATLKRFGLLEEVAGSGPRSLKVSQAAMDLMKYESTDPAAYRKQLKFMALLPDLHEAIWNKYGHVLPSDKTIETHLVFERHFAAESAKQFIRLYKETISFAKLTEGDSVEETMKPATENDGEKLTNPTKANSADKAKDNNYMETTINMGELPIPIAGKVARIPFPMSEDDFDLFIGTLNLWKKKLVRKLTSIPPSVLLPANALWKNNDTDKSVKIVAVMGERDGEQYYQSEDGTGIPASQLTFGGIKMPVRKSAD